MSFLGVDLGTSFIKGAVLNLDKRQLEHIRRAPFPEPVATGDPLRCEYDPNEIVSAVRTLIAELAAHARDCEGVVMCTQMHGLVLMNDRHEAVSNCVTWRDQRAMAQHPSGAGSYFDVILARTNAEERRQLGNELEPARPLCFLFWFREQGKLEPGLIPASIPDFVLCALGGSKPGVDVTNASAYGAYNLKTSDWHHGVIRALGLDRLCWPPLRKPRDVAGYLQVGSKSVPCYAPVGDAQAALCGALLSTEELSLNIATGAQVSRLTHELNLGSYQTRPYFDKKFLNTFSYPPAGRALNVLVTLLTEMAVAQNVQLPDPWTYIAEAVARIRATDLQVDLDFFPASAGDSGKIVNIRGDNLTVGHLLGAAFRNMADSYYRCAVQLWPEKSWERLVFSGGLPCKLETLRGEIQKKFGSGCRLAPQTEDALFGLLILASVVSGKAKSIDQISNELRTSEMNTCG